MDSLTSIHKCDCDRPWCEYFAPGYGDTGTSFSRERLEEMLVTMKENVKTITKVLKEK